MEKKIGVYICSGCDIDKAVDTEKLEKVAANEYKVPVCKTHPFLCSQEGVQLMKDDLNNEGVNTFVIAACSPRYHQTTFEMGEGTIMLRAPIREQAAWILEPRDGEGNVNEDTQMAAEDYVRMYTARIKSHSLPEPYKQEETNKSVLVIGGGVAGMTAAVETAKAGYEVNLVEKTDKLGGYALNYKSIIPSEPPFEGLMPNDVADLVSETEGNDGITVHKSSTVASIEGEPGAFQVKLSGGAEFTGGGIVLASGSSPYDAGKLTHLGIENDNVISSQEFEAMAVAGSIKRKDGQPAKSVAFIQCAGSRDPDHLSYCSATCCMNSLKQAAYVREMDKDAKAYIIYKDMRTPGQYEAFYRAQQDDPGVFLTKGEVVGVNEESDKRVSVDVDNTLLGENIQLKVDLLVLAVGQVPSTLGEESILNLQYRQGPDMPELKDGYPDSHFVCFPYETRRTGIYAAGTVRQPMDLNFAKRDAGGAALKAIQAAEMTDQGKRVHPRSGDLTFMEPNLTRCTDCKRCTEECPFGAIDENEKGTPLPKTARCRACGICMGACPERVVSFADYSVPILSEMIKNIEIPDEDDEKPRILVFICENDALPALDQAALNRARISPFVRFVPLRCLGGNNLVFVSDALSVGIDGVMYMGCKHGDDYQCHFIKGSELCDERLGKVQETIGRLALESERIQQFEISMNDSDNLPKIIDDFMEEMDDYGPNPFKGM
ncbi:MAG: hydrogenase iron-sulfur subunit [Proteobacteria bacterium]|nr:hydrogenase iron-sulfur subunit [Pseudomonadota bacterium]